MRSSFFLLILTVTVLILGSCCLFKPCPGIIPITTVDSSYTETIYDTQIDTVLLPLDSALYQAYLECLNGKVIEKNVRNDNGKHTQVTVKLVDNKLTVRALDSGSIVEKYNLAHQITTKTKVITQTLPPVTTNILTKWQIFRIYLGNIFMGILTLLLLWGIFKIYKALQPKI